MIENKQKACIVRPLRRDIYVNTCQGNYDGGAYQQKILVFAFTRDEAGNHKKAIITNRSLTDRWAENGRKLFTTGMIEATRSCSPRDPTVGDVAHDD